jgi:DcmR-like sensory protein
MSDEISFRHGDHICLFYNDINEQTILTVPFVKVGLLRGERCLCVLTTAQSDRLCSSLRASGIDPQKEVSRGALLFATPEEAYLATGKFQREAMVKLLNDGMQEALRLGFTGFRGTGDLTWAARDTGVCAQLPEYETMLDRYYPGTRSLGICMYDMRVFSAGQIDRLLKAHRLAILHPEHSKRAIRIRRDGVFGDVIFDRIRPSSVFHYVIQKDNSQELLMSGQDDSLTGAMNAVEAAIAALPSA